MQICIKENKIQHLWSACRCALFWACAVLLFFTSYIQTGNAACLVPTTSTSIDHFVKDPSSLLVSNNNKTETIVWRTRIFASASLKSLKAIEKIVPKANLVQKIAIGEGMARANSACSARDGEISHRINDTIRRISDRDVTRSYLKFLTGGENKGFTSPKEDEIFRHNSLGFDSNVKLIREIPSTITKFK
jgi:hypothetical protein